jgi:HAD superfamily hydrolase (TIGR01509 family)
MAFEEAFDEFAGKNIMYITSYMEKHIGRFDHHAFENDYRSRCLNIFDKELECIEGVVELIESLTVPSCIASNGPHSKMDVTLKVTSLDKYFSKETIYSAYDISKWKPDPELYLHALNKMSCDVRRAIIVEDTIAGLMGAVNAGIDVVAYNPMSKQELYVDGVLNFKTMKSIQDHFMSLGIAS